MNGLYTVIQVYVRVVGIQVCVFWVEWEEKKPSESIWVKDALVLAVGVKDLSCWRTQNISLKTICCLMQDTL